MSTRIQARLPKEETDALERIAKRMEKVYSDIRKVDGDLNVSAVIRHLIREDVARNA